MKKALINYIKNPKNDELYTPKYAIVPILKYIPKDSIIWECCDFGESEITKTLREHNYKVLTSGKKENFFEYEPKEDYDIIITNPPYSLKDEFLERCYKLNKPFMLLLPITALEGVKRHKLYKRHGLEVIVFDKRVNFLDNKKSNWFNTSWFCYKILKNKLVFENLKEEK